MRGFLGNPQKISEKKDNNSPGRTHTGRKWVVTIVNISARHILHDLVGAEIDRVGRT